MDPHQFRAYCEVCGEPGMGTLRAAAALWDPYSTTRHTNPAVCAANLARRRRELEKREAAVAMKEAEV